MTGRTLIPYRPLASYIVSTIVEDLRVTFLNVRIHENLTLTLPLGTGNQESSYHCRGPGCPVRRQNREGCTWSEGQEGRHTGLRRLRQARDIEGQWEHPMALKRISKAVGRENVHPEGGLVIMIRPL